VTDSLADRQRDHATSIAAIGRIYVHSTDMRPRNSVGWLLRCAEILVVTEVPVTEVSRYSNNCLRAVTHFTANILAVCISLLYLSLLIPGGVVKILPSLGQ